MVSQLQWQWPVSYLGSGQSATLAVVNQLPWQWSVSYLGSGQSATLAVVSQLPWQWSVSYGGSGQSVIVCKYPFLLVAACEAADQGRRLCRPRHPHERRPGWGDDKQ